MSEPTVFRGATPHAEGEQVRIGRTALTAIRATAKEWKLDVLPTSAEAEFWRDHGDGNATVRWANGLSWAVAVADLSRVDEQLPLAPEAA